MNDARTVAARHWPPAKPPSQPRQFALISARERGEIVVADNGPGLPSETIDGVRSTTRGYRAAAANRATG
jgi:hypothetical protein